MCAPAIGLAGSVLGSVGQFASGSAAASAQNRAAIAQYKYQLKIRRNNWKHERQRYATKLGQYGNTLAENNAAANRAYASEQRKLNNIFKAAAFKSQDLQALLTKESGKMAASGRLGKSADRVEQSLLSDFGRKQAVLAESLLSAQYGYQQNTAGIRRQQLSANNQAFSDVAVAPEPDVAPPPPAMAQGPSPLSLMGGLLGAGADFGTAMASMKTPKPPEAYIPNFSNSYNF